MAQSPWHLGQTSEHYETGGRGPGSISHTPGDPGGPSYGLSQFALNTGSLREYLDQSRYAAAFKGVELGSSTFDAKWREVAKADPTDFAQDQHDFTKTQFYDVQSARLKMDGLDLSRRGPSVQDALWSTSVQFHDLTPSIFKKGLEEKFGRGFDLSKLSDKDIVGAVQDYKIAHNDHLFSHSSTAVKASVQERAKEEKADLLHLADGTTVEHAQHNEAGHSAASIQKQGASGHAVTTLQTNLATLGYTDHKGKPLAADGVFGIDTRHAVERFQHDHHLAVDGKIGPLTQQALRAAFHEHAKQVAAPPGLDEPRHPAHALYAQALSGVHALDVSMGRTTDVHSLNLTAALVVEAKHEGLTRIDRVALSDDASRAFVVQHSTSPLELSKFASVDTLNAMNTPMAHSNLAAASIQSPASVQTTTPAQVPTQVQAPTLAM